VIFPQIKPSDGLGKAFMTRLEIAALACKILALWVVVQIAFLIEYAIYFVIMFVTAAVQKGGNPWSQIAGSSAILGVEAFAYLPLAWVLWFKAPRIAKRMVSDDPNAVTPPTFTQKDAMTVAFASVGVMLLVPAIRNVSRIFLNVFFNSDQFKQAWGDVNWQSNFWSSVIELALAMWLTFGFRGITRLVLSMRRADLQPNPAQSESDEAQNS
jgi:hypothetical protein